MSANVHLAGASQPTFFNQFFSLKNTHSLGHLLATSFVAPTKRAIYNGVQNHKALTPLLAIPFGIGMLAIGVAYVVEGVFKGLVKMLLAIATLDKEGMKKELRNGCACSIVGVAISLGGIVSATAGTLGLVIAPNWAYRNVIAFSEEKKNDHFRRSFY